MDTDYRDYWLAMARIFRSRQALVDFDSPITFSTKSAFSQQGVAKVN
jgi:hypothetical protein